MVAIPMVDVHLPTTDGRTVILSRHTEPQPDQAHLLRRLKISLPDQPPPRISQTAFRHHNDNPSRGADLVTPHPRNRQLEGVGGYELRQSGCVGRCDTRHCCTRRRPMAPGFKADSTVKSRLLLSRILTTAKPDFRAIVFLADSITDGNCSTVDTNNRWPSQNGCKRRTTRT
jgi:hypothetical protein